MWYVQTSAEHGNEAVPTENELRKSIARTYWKAEQRWKSWRGQHPKDSRPGINYSGSSEEDGIANDWRAFDVLFKSWKSRHLVPSGYFWGIGYPSHEPELMKSAYYAKKGQP
jgi:hypothetical protein